MEDKINAYNKISLAIKSSRNELHLQTCSVMIGVFAMRYNDESMKALLKDEWIKKRKKVRASRFKDVFVINN
jgi:hypothetical protein